MYRVIVNTSSFIGKESILGIIVDTIRMAISLYNVQIQMTIIQEKLSIICQGFVGF